ncbi:hypothetical protein AYI70_g4192 [Smittium culicis]|uniref:Uncharacterized protein n=1 Tax=Smittium culicis TaxID=133412 RepID=A0A1R1Y0C4_9FUNG|nr:hypothetical protein AYI70_g4192 [Smittium culicis]
MKELYFGYDSNNGKYEYSIDPELFNAAMNCLCNLDQKSNKNQDFRLNLRFCAVSRPKTSKYHTFNQF